MRARPQNSRTSSSMAARVTFGSTGGYFPIGLSPAFLVNVGASRRSQNAPSLSRDEASMPRGTTLLGPAPRLGPPHRPPPNGLGTGLPLSRADPSASTGRPAADGRFPFGRRLGEDVRRIEPPGSHHPRLAGAREPSYSFRSSPLAHDCSLCGR